MLDPHFLAVNRWLCVTPAWTSIGFPTLSAVHDCRLIFFSLTCTPEKLNVILTSIRSNSVRGRIAVLPSRNSPRALGRHIRPRQSRMQSRVGTLQCACTCPLKSGLSRRVSPQTKSRSVQPFLHSSPLCPTHTDRQKERETDRPRYVRHL